MRRGGFLSFGGWLIVALAGVSAVVVALWAVPKRQGMSMWIFSTNHERLYKPLVADWNTTRDPDVNFLVLGQDAMGRRMMSGFLSDTPLPDLIEVEKQMAGRAFTGPIEDVGFVDLTDRIKAEGLDQELNAPSFGPWTSRGRVFGLPHDVHPVMLAYRADLVEAAGIDVTQIETWDDFARVMKPLIKDLDGDGNPDRYPLNLSEIATDPVETLFLQAGGSFFDENEKLTIDSDVNARVVATIISWTTGPDRIAGDAGEFSASGNQLRLQGYVVCWIAPDWLCGVWKADLPQLSGKMKLMPLPAWTRGGRRTSVWGGTMLGIPKATKDFETAWAFAKHLYLSEDVARGLYESNNIVTPVKKFWSSAFYDKPDPWFSNQAPGRRYLNLAPDVPRRASSPFNPLAKARVTDALRAVRRYAEENNVYTADKLYAEAHKQLAIAQAAVQKQMDRNVFLAEEK